MNVCSGGIPALQSFSPLSQAALLWPLPHSCVFSLLRLLNNCRRLRTTGDCALPLARSNSLPLSTCLSGFQPAGQP